MTIFQLMVELFSVLSTNPKLGDLPIEIEHRNCEDDRPEGVGIYPYSDHVGLSFWRD